MTEQQSPLDVFMARAERSLRLMGTVTEAIKVPGTPARSSLSVSQRQMLDMASGNSPDGAIHGVFEQLVTQVVTIDAYFESLRRGRCEKDFVIPTVIDLTDKLVTQMKVAEHNFAMAAGVDLQSTSPREVSPILEIAEKNKTAFWKMFKIAVRANLDEYHAAEAELIANSTPLSFREMAVVFHHAILPELETALAALREACPEESRAYTQEAEKTYADMLQTKPQFAAWFAGRFTNTGNPFFDEATGPRLAELQMATWYNGGSYQYTPIKPAAWAEARNADQIAAAKFIGCKR